MNIINRLKMELKNCDYLIKEKIEVDNDKLKEIKKIAKKINSENKSHKITVNGIKFIGSGYSKIEISKRNDGDYSIIIKKMGHINHRINGGFILIKLSELKKITIDKKIIFNID